MNIYPLGSFKLLLLYKILLGYNKLVLEDSLKELIKTFQIILQSRSVILKKDPLGSQGKNFHHMYKL